MHFEMNIISPSDIKMAYRYRVQDWQSSNKMKDQAVVKGNLGPGVWQVSESLAKYIIVSLSDCHSLDKTGEESGGTWG